MNRGHSQTSFKNKEQRGANHAEERAKQLRDNSQRSRKVSSHEGYSKIILDLLKRPASLGSVGGFRGHQR